RSLLDSLFQRQQLGGTPERDSLHNYNQEPYGHVPLRPRGAGTAGFLTAHIVLLPRNGQDAVGAAQPGWQTDETCRMGEKAARRFLEFFSVNITAPFGRAF